MIRCYQNKRHKGSVTGCGHYRRINFFYFFIFFNFRSKSPSHQNLLCWKINGFRWVIIIVASSSCCHPMASWCHPCQFGFCILHDEQLGLGLAFALQYWSWHWLGPGWWLDFGFDPVLRTVSVPILVVKILCCCILRSGIGWSRRVPMRWNKNQNSEKKEKKKSKLKT